MISAPPRPSDIEDFIAYERKPDGRLALQMALHPGQDEAWESDARILLILAGTQGGKTSFGSAWLWREIEATRVPGGENDYLAASANYDLIRLKMLPEMEKFFRRNLGWSYSKGDRIFTNPEQDCRIILRSAEAPEGLESATIKAAWLDEWGLPTVGIECWEAVQRRLSIYQGRVVFTTTPYAQNWLKQQVFDRWKGGDRDYAVVQFKSCDNPSFPMAEYERMQRTLPSWKFEMMYNGVFTRPAGLIYTDYSDSYATFARDKDGLPGRRLGGGNLCRPFTIPDTWMRDLGVDFGPVNESRLWFAQNPATQDVYVYREAHGGGKGHAEYAAEVLAYKEPLRRAFGGAASEEEIRIIWGQAGVPMARPLLSDVEAGIDRANALFKAQRLFVFDTCTGLRSELGTYSRELDAAGEPTAKIDDKAKYHRLDALRYGASGYPLDVEAAEIELPERPPRVPSDDPGYKVEQPEVHDDEYAW